MRAVALALRHLLKTPFVTSVAVVSLGLGIGANTAVFSLFNQILLRPLPVSAPNELVNLAAPGPKSGSVSCGNAGDCDAVFSYPMYLDLARDQQVFTGIAAHHLFGANIGYRDQTLAVDGMEVSGNYFGLLGLQPVLGRLIAPGDTTSIGSAPVAVLSYDYWMTRFGHDPNITSSTVVVNGQALGIIGVAPPAFDGTTRGTRAKIFVPITLRALLEPPFTEFDKRNTYWVYLFARLKPGGAMAAADAGINGPYHTLMTEVELPMQAGLSAADQKAAFTDKRLTLEDGRRGQSYIFKQAATPLAWLQVVTAVVLLIACANIANLLLARAAGRAGEMAIRLSIGASRSQLIRQLLLESCLLAALGGIAGLVILQWTTAIMVAKLPFGAIDPAVSRISLGVLLFAAAMALGTGVLFGVFPAFHATRPDLATALKGQAGQPAGAKAAAWFRSILVVTQIALSMGLLTCAGLFTKSLLNVSRVDLGVKIDHVIAFNLNPQRAGYTPVRAQQLFQDVIARLSGMPSVVSASAARVPLIANSSSSTSIGVEGYVATPGERMSINFNEIAPGYFQTVGTPLLAGRDFTDGDVFTAPKVAIVNEAFAKRFNLGPNPVGHRMRRGTGTPTYDMEIVGVVKDAKYSSVRATTSAVFFTPYRQNDRLGAISFYAKTTGDPSQLLSAIRPLVASFDSTLPVQRLGTMPQQIDDNLSDDRLMSTLSASFAGLATVLAAIGLYGVLAYTVSQRTREFGLRMALGASPHAVQRLVLTYVMRLTLIGGAIGLGLAMAAGYYARTQLFEMRSTDPTVLAASAAALTLVALLAGFVPSLRASRVDPMQALRWE
jgi:predicted permease